LFQTKEIERIFERFYQVNSVTGRTFGAGIGLHIVKNLVDAHKGTIEVKSNGKGKGTVFTVKIPLEKELSEITEREEKFSSRLINDFSVILDDDTDNQETENHVNSHSLTDNMRFSVLIVEDNNELRKLISRHLSGEYEVFEAKNGTEGFDMARKLHPDLIVADVMMPEMNGFEMCTKLKQDINYSHIMIILLTAKVTNDDRAEGYRAGADSYLTKPLDIKLLKARIESLKKQRELIKEKYSNGIISESHPEELSPLNIEFMKQIVSSVMDEIGNPDFNVTMLIDKIHISHSTLYRKIHSITGMSPNEFIRNIRINEAAKLMNHKNVNISEIATKVGFNDHSYFTRSFKKKFNKTPKQFVSEK
jgi:YesN/AraC family two-component response regulator